MSHRAGMHPEAAFEEDICARLATIFKLGFLERPASLQMSQISQAVSLASLNRAPSA